MARTGPDLLSDSRSVRVEAPIQAVWKEIESIELILAKIPVIGRTTVDQATQRARYRARLAWGPFAWTVNGQAEVIEVVPTERISFTILIPTMDLGETGRFELSAVAAEETNLSLSADIRVGRMRKVIKGVVEDQFEAHLRSLLKKAAAGAERHWLAHQRLEARNNLNDR